MNRIIATSLAAVCAALLVACAERHSPPAVVDEARLVEHIRILSSDDFGGRAPMTEGGRKTVAYLTQQFRDAGLAPLFGDSYTQAVRLVSIEAEPAPLRVGDATYEYGSQAVLWTRRAERSAAMEDSELVFVGYGVNAPEYGWNDYEGVDMRGKTAVILVNDPGYATQGPELFRGNTMTYYGRWTYKYDEAARQGAAAAIIVHQTAPASYPWGVVESSWTGPQLHLASAAGAPMVQVEGWVQKAVADEIFAAAGRDFAALEAAAARRGFRAVPLGLRASASLSNTLEFSESPNVGGMVRGTERPDELFIYMGHWDHLGTDLALIERGEDGIYNGALDNATGTAALIELGRAFAAGDAPRRSVAFLAVTAEESGLLGSAGYVGDPPYPMHKTVAGVNMDGLNIYGPTDDLVVVGYQSSELEDIIAVHAARQGRSLVQEATPEKGFYYRSDHFNFAKRGVPILYAEGGTVHREHGREYMTEKQAQYTADSYHQPSDEYSDDWDLRGALEDLQLYYDVGRQIADGDEWPQWYQGNEFRQIREQSLRLEQ